MIVIVHITTKNSNDEEKVTHADKEESQREYYICRGGSTGQLVMASWISSVSVLESPARFFIPPFTPCLDPHLVAAEFDVRLVVYSQQTLTKKETIK